ncbi:hypothetical protein BC938DRAFT_475350 [Jimgerdemannia flammicorona]|uniref:Uncharacterized protein n=1 Tax=Jimgerdemannia flammicorona TaxID=994334 RepID=A0A433QRP9_9FUNG|nr:hypothetical protein BC938DRAFT_475350 [Jimgerdemannia flammicorona]
MGGLVVTGNGRHLQGWDLEMHCKEHFVRTLARSMEWNGGSCSLQQKHSIVTRYHWTTSYSMLLSQNGLLSFGHSLTSLHDAPEVLLSVRLHSAIRGCRRIGDLHLSLRDNRILRDNPVPALRTGTYDIGRHSLGDGKLEVSVELPKSPRGRLPSRDPVRHATTRRAVPSVARIEPCFGRQELWLPPVARFRLRLYTLAALQIRYGFTGTYIAVLGGAYSALGKYKEKYARKAGELALQQIKLAQLMRDPVQESKCWLYYAEDCIGVGMLKTAVRIIRKQRTFAKKTHDETLIKMCESTRGKLEAARDRLRNGKMVGQGCDDIESVDNRSIGTICLV